MKKTIKYSLLLAILLIGMAGTATASGFFVGAYSFVPFTEKTPLVNGSYCIYHSFTLDLEETGLPTEWFLTKNGEQIASGWYNGNYTKVEMSYAKEIITAMAGKKSPVADFSLDMTTAEGESIHIDYSQITEWDYYDNPDEVPLQIWGIRNENPTSGIFGVNIDTAMCQYPRYLLVRNCGFETFYGKIRLALQDNGHNRNVETEVLTIPPGEAKEVFVGYYPSGNNDLFLWQFVEYSPQFPDKTTCWYI